MSTYTQIKSIMDGYQWKGRQRAFKSSIDRTYSYAVGDVEGMFKYVPINARENELTAQIKPKSYRLIVKRILGAYIDGVAGLPIKRTLPDLYKSYDLTPIVKNINLRDIQTVTEVCGTSAVFPTLGMNGEMSYEIIGADNLLPLTSKGVLTTLAVTRPDGGMTIYTPWEITHVTPNGLETTTPNPYGVIPCGIFRASEDPKSGAWYGISELASFVPNNVSVNKILTDLQSLTRDKTFPQWVFKGGDTKNPNQTTVQSGPDELLGIGQDDDLVTVAPDASPSEIQAVADTLTDKTYEDAAVDSVVQQSDVQSGYALKIKRGPYLNKMRTKRELYKEADQKLVELSVLIYETMKNMQSFVLSDDFKVNTEFDDSSLSPESSDEQMKEDSFDLTNGVMSRVDLVQKRYGVSRTEALDMIKRIDSDNAQNKDQPVG